MKKIIPALVFISSICTYGSVSPPTLGVPIINGSGCAPGTTQFVLSPDDLTLSVLFDTYKAEAGNGTPSETKQCIASIPIHIPEGSYLSLVQVDYRGFNSLPVGGSSDLVTHYRFQGGTGKLQKRTTHFRGPLLEDFLDRDVESVKSQCGGTENLIITSELTVRTNPKHDQAFSEIDTADLVLPKRKIIYSLKMKNCADDHDPHHGIDRGVDSTDGHFESSMRTEDPRREHSEGHFATESN